jgi:hypothetical protein
MVNTQVATSLTRKLRVTSVAISAFSGGRSGLADIRKNITERVYIFLLHG